ncbi:hypothetical protein [Gorillibacterium massiliense]|uniref:hypothetical protein n=1 Tax=Gorillibacterium massiliense TaxID=1280390 RepID=UPI0012DD9BD2|nr:hypothetical protein [Gorillibacterium massiliense]
MKLVTEDCIRYEFYGSLLSNVYPHEIILEYPHDTLSQKEIDLVINNSVLESIFEFKYYRAIPSGQEDRTARMANIYIDIMKLKLSNVATDKYFVFVTDSVMYGYCLRNQYENMIQEDSFEFVVSPKHQEGLNFKKVVFKKLPESTDMSTPIVIKRVYYKELEQDHYLFIYKILS